MSLARTDSIDHRTEILGRLIRRNRMVAVLRVLVPAAGVVAFLVLAGQIWVTNMMRQYGVSGIHIDRGNLVVDTPQYSGTGSDGSSYTLNAREARAPIENTQLIDMTDATLDFNRPNKSPIHLSAAFASMDTGSEVVTIPGVTTMVSEDGMHGTFTEVKSNSRSDLTTADGPVDITFSDGTHLLGSSMRYEGSAALWSFTDVTLTIPSLPKSSEADPLAESAGETVAPVEAVSP